MNSEFYNSRLVSVFCFTNGVYFVDMLPEIIFASFRLFCDITFNTSSSFVSSLLGFRRPRNYHAWSSRVWICFICLTREKSVCVSYYATASSPSIAETVPSKRPTLSISSSIIFCCFLIISSDLLVWWFSCCWDVGAGAAGGVTLMLVVQAFLGVFLFFLFLIHLLFKIIIL